MEEGLVKVMEQVGALLASSKLIRCSGPTSPSGHHYTQSPVILKDSSTLTYVSICSFCGNSIEHLIPINRTTEQLTGVSLVSEVQ